MDERETDKSSKLPGIYRHKETGAEVELKIQPKLGTPLINAFIRSGFEYVGPAPKAELKPEVVSEPKDEYTQAETKSGAIQYRKNGKLISKDEYDKSI